MINNSRRTFLHRSSLVAASTALTACGGGGSSEELENQLAGSISTNADAGSGALSMPSMPSVRPSTPIPGARFTVLSTTGQTTVPFSLGFAFKKGAVVAGRTAMADIGTMQVVVKNRWPDGSMKFAILSGLVNVPSAAGVTVNLSSVAESAVASPIDTSRLRASGVVAEIGCGSFGIVRWDGAGWDTPFKTWVAGPAMSSWIYRKPVGTDKHLVAWLEVRMWANGAIEVLPWIENGFLLVAGPSNKAAIYTVMLNRTQRMSAAIDLKHHQRTALISGTELSYWSAQDMGSVARQDTAYLQATELVPSYIGKLAPGAAVLNGLAATYQPLQAGNFRYDSDNMGAPGAQEPIGLLPQHDVAYLISDSLIAYASLIRNGYGAGRYGIHYRDETTNRPLRFSKYPTLNIREGNGFAGTGGSTMGLYTPMASGGNPPVWDVSHSPSVGFTAYLATGRFYFMEEVQFATTTNYLGNGDNAVLRVGAKGLVQSCPGAWQTRCTAWDWRARVQALAVTPDDDLDLRNEFIASVEANIEHFHGRYVAQANNPFGWIKPGEQYDSAARQGAPWQQDFVTAAFGYSVSLGLPVSGTASNKLAAFFAWKAQSAIMRLGTRDEFWYINGAPYTMMISPVKANYDTGAGPWYPNAKAVYDASYAVAPAWMGKTEGVLAAEFMPGENAMWGNLVPAIAYAVQHNVPGAQAAYDRMVSASNWRNLADAFNVRPVWGIKPARYIAPPVFPVAPVEPEKIQTGDPVWLSTGALNQWIEISNTGGAGGAAIFAYSGIAYNEKTNEIMIACAGGHLDSGDNRVVSMKLTANVPTWKLLMAPSAKIVYDQPYYPDGRPSSRHLYSMLHFVPQVNRLIMFGCREAVGNAHSFPNIDAYNPDTNQWDASTTWGVMPKGHAGAVTIRSTGEVWSTGLARWSPVTKAWTHPITKRSSEIIHWPMAHDTVRNQLFTLNFDLQALHATRIPCNGDEQISVKFNPSPALTQFMADKPTYAGMDYDPHNDRFLFYCGIAAGAGRVYVVKPNASNTWDMSILQLTGTKLPPATPDAGVHNRFRYIPALRGFLLLPSHNSNIFFLRVAA